MVKAKRKHIGKRVAVIRCSEWDITQAVPRTVNSLKAEGFKVTVLCWDFSQKKPLKEKLDGFKILRFQRRLRYTSLTFILSWPLWWWWIAKTCLAERFDFVHVMNLESVVPAVLVKKLAKHRIVYDIRDPWGMMTSRMPWPIPQFFSLQDEIFSACADGIVLSQGRLSQCADYFGKATSTRVPTVQVLNVPYADMRAESTPSPVKPLRINFSGHISWARNLAAIIDTCRHVPDIHLDLVGEIQDREIWESIRGLQNISVYGRVPFTHAMELIEASSLVCVMYNTDTRIAQVASANKMFEAMMMARPYAASSNGYPADIAEKYSVGWSLPYGDRLAFQRLIKSLLVDPDKIVKTGRRGRQLYCSRFKWNGQKENLLQLYSHLAGKPEGYRNVGGWCRFIGNTIADD